MFFFAEQFKISSVIFQALAATLFTWFVTALGASAVFFFKTVDRTLLDGMLGFAAAVLLIKPLLPFALAFAAGAMIYVVVEELIPESQIDKRTDVATFGSMIGFVVMMMYDVALG